MTTLPGAFTACHQHLIDSGFDLLHWFSVSSLNESVPDEFALPTLGTPGAVGLLVANSKALWPVFLRDLARQLRFPGGLSDVEVLEETMSISEDPLDDFVVRSVEAAAALESHEHWIGHGHITGPGVIPLQRYADVLGFAPMGRGDLCLHPIHGPWIALRAVVVFAGCDDDQPGTLSAPLPSPSSHGSSCDGCQAPCLDRVRDTSFLSPLLGRLPAERQEWLIRRLACPQGSQSRYSDQQLYFHYRERGRPDDQD